MSTATRLPLLKAVPPEVWTALTWCVATAYSLVMFVRLPGEVEVPFIPFQAPLDHTARSWSYLVVATTLALTGSALLRRRPLPAVVLLLAGSVAAAMALNSTQIAFLQFLAVDVALCFIAATQARRTSIAAITMGVGVLAGYAVARVLLGYPIGTSTQLAVALSAIVAWLAGNSIRQAREHAHAMVAQATTQAVTAERLRISRELHDSVAHSIGIIALQAGAASRVIDTQPSAARSAMTAVETTSRQTLTELRRMLGLLRDTDAAQHRASFGPAPGLADVERLAEATSAAGLQVQLRWLGDHRPLPTDIGISAYRIIQESITNVIRHAATTTCRVTIDQRDNELAITIDNDGRCRVQRTGTGHGIAGMRERVQLLHGHFHAGPRPEGGFHVIARLPVPAAPQ
ncbi:sensor histidine kinase [Micromonospora sp. NPDC047548]|uniref:sensor histidine kinase n=1 Tax=Micromonospora sp. NPDC047548 TaxID=3155624 RepID=UPI0033E8752B